MLLSLGHIRQGHVAYRSDIDGLRAIAVLSVFLFHLDIGVFAGGYTGVDIFFVISGFLITGNLAKDIQARRMSFGDFYARRIRRIFPALFVVLIITWIAGLYLLLPPQMEEASRSLIAASASVANILFWRTADYFALDSAYQPHLHTWSLSVEEQFYLVVPILMVLLRRLVAQRWWILFALITIVSFALSVHASTTNVIANFYLLPTRAWELSIGALAATLPLSPRLRARGPASGVAALGLGLIASAILLLDDTVPFPGTYALLPCLGAACVIYVGRHTATPVARVLSCRPFVALGLISYSLYLWHWPLISLTRYYDAGELTAAQKPVIVAAAFALAALTWRFVEQPFRIRTTHIANRTIIAGGVLVAGLTMLVGVAGWRSLGFPRRFPDFVYRPISAEATWKPGECFFGDAPDPARWKPEACTRLSRGTRRVLLWGDSFAAHYVPGILAHADAIDATIVQYTAAGCQPIFVSKAYGQMRCRAFNARVPDLIAAMHIDTVVIASRWTGFQKRGYGEIVATVERLRALNVRVAMIGQSPEFPIDVQIADYIQRWHARVQSGVAPMTFPTQINAALRSNIGDVDFYDPLPIFCAEDACRFKEGDKYLFADIGHYSQPGSEAAAGALIKEGLFGGAQDKR